MMSSIVAWLVAIVLCARLVSADVKLTFPAPGASVAAGTLSLQWQDSGALPRLSSIAAADIVLCTGSDTNIQALYTLNGGVPMSSKTSQQVTIPASLGTNGQYFIKFVETTTTGQVVVTYSGRFTLTGMIGSLVASTGLSTNAPPGTTPAAVTNTATTTPTTATTGTVQTSPLGTGALQAYATQTGLTRSAPPQRKPGRSITADPDAAQPLYQTSAYKPFQTFGATPVVMTTLIPSQTWTLTSYENQATPAQFVAGAHL